MSDVKKSRIEYLRALYTKALEHDPVNPASIKFGLYKYGKLIDGQVELDEGKSGGYLIGEALGLTKTEVEAIVYYYCSSERQYLTSGLGMQIVGITQRGIDYLEYLNEKPESSTAFTGMLSIYRVLKTVPFNSNKAPRDRLSNNMPKSAQVISISFAS